MNRDLLTVLKEQRKTFSKGQRMIADYIDRDFDKAAYMTASKLGAAVGVSESTIVRFAIELGYDGYPEFSRALQELIRTRLTSKQRMCVTNALIGEGDILEKVVMSDIEKLRETLENIDRVHFEKAVDAIIAAKKIYIIGVRSSSSLASFLNFNFNLIFDNVRFIQTTSGSEMFEQLLPMEAEDVMIAISFPRYSSRIINAVAYAKENGANVVALTDSDMSPIASYADELLTARSDMASYVDSLVAPLSIINALLVAISRKKQDELAVKFDRLERIWEEYDVYAKGQQ